MSATSGADRSCRPARRACWIKAAQFGLYSIQFTDPFDAVLGNRCCSVASDLHQFAPCVSPAIGEMNVWTNALRRNQPVVSGIAIDLPNAGEALQYPFCMNAPANRRIGEGDAGRSTAAPRSVIPRQRPEASGLGLARAGIEDPEHGSRP